MRPYVRPALTLFLMTWPWALVACKPDPGPTLDIAFPPPASLTTSAAVTIRGTTEPGTRITVNGTDAAPGTLPGMWSLDVSLVPGANTLEVIAHRDGATTHRAVTVVHNEHRILFPRAVTINGDAAYFTSNEPPAILSVSTDADGLVEVVASPDTGAGPELVLPTDVVADVAGNRLLVADAGAAAVVAIDLATGARTIVSGTSVGGGPAFQLPTDLDLDEDDARVFVIDALADALVAVDLSTGERTVVSDAAIGTGPEFVDPNAIAVEGRSNTAYVADLGLASGTPRVLSVDLATGDRVARAETGQVNGVTLDAGNGRLLLTDVTSSAITAVRLDDGSQNVLSDVTSAGAALTTPMGIDLDEATGALVVTDAAADAVLTVDPATGAREALAQTRAGEGPPLIHARDVARDPKTGSLFVLDGGAGFDAHLATVDPASGARTHVVELSAVDPTSLSTCGGRAFLLDASTSDLLGVRIDGGVVEVLPTTLQVPQALVTHADCSHLYVTDLQVQGIVSIDLENGAQVVVSSQAEGVGTGPAFTQPDVLTWSPDATELIVADEGRLVAVDTASGNRRTLAAVDPVVDLASDDESVWVLHVDGTLARIDPISGEYTQRAQSAELAGWSMIAPIAWTMGPGGIAHAVDGSRDALVAVDLVTLEAVAQSK